MRCGSYLFMFGIILIRAQGDQSAHTLSTAKLAVQPSAHPTTLHIVIDVQQDAEKSSTIDIFRPEARRSSTDIWDWDFWCQMQPKTGDCIGNITKYYYDAQLDQCVIFSYTGCKGNENQFDTKVDCERHCKGAAYMPIKSVWASSACPLQPNAGLCLGYFEKFYYDVNSQTCRTFVYGGCGGNLNRFNTDVQCAQLCGNLTRKDETYEVALRKKKKENSDDSDDGFWDPSTSPWITLYDGLNPQEREDEDSSSSGDVK